MLKEIVYNKNLGDFDYTFGAEVEIYNFDGGNGFDTPKFTEELS
jgi:hypothetical protein